MTRGQLGGLVFAQDQVLDAGGSRKVVRVMHKDSQKFADTGGWGFEGFKGDSHTERAVGAKAATACYQCHVPQQDKDFVFSRLRP